MTLQRVWTGARKSRSRRATLQVEQLESRLVPYSVTGNSWPSPQLVTISFMPDGTILGSNGSTYIYSNLFSVWNAHFGSAAKWQNQILKAAQVWAQQTSINFAVVPDNGSQEGSGLYQQGDPGAGDIRIGGYNFGTGTLAQAFMPAPANNYSGAGDIQFNTGQGFNIGTTYDLFTVAAHEIGHALGLSHSTAGGSPAPIMNGVYTCTHTALTADDITGIRAIYSGGNPRSPDAYDTGGGDNGFATAANITSQIDPVLLTAVVNNLNIVNTSDVAYYTFTAPSGTTGTLTATVQSQGLSLLAPKMWVYAADQSTVLGFANGTAQYGTTLSLTVSNVTAGQQFYLKVSGADASAFGTGAYAVTLNFGTGSAPTVPLPNTTLLNGSPLSMGGGLPQDSDGDVGGADSASTLSRDHADVPAAPASAAATVAVTAADTGSLPAATVVVVQGPAPGAGVRVQEPGVSERGPSTPPTPSFRLLTPERGLPAAPAAGAPAPVPAASDLIIPTLLTVRQPSGAVESGGGAAAEPAGELPATPALPADGPDAPADRGTSTRPAKSEATPLPEVPVADRVWLRLAEPDSAADEAALDTAPVLNPAAAAATLAFLFAWGSESEPRRRAV
jgi:hypothetical protein